MPLQPFSPPGFGATPPLLIRGQSPFETMPRRRCPHGVGRSRRAPGCRLRTGRLVLISDMEEPSGAPARRFPACPASQVRVLFRTAPQARPVQRRQGASVTLRRRGQRQAGRAGLARDDLGDAGAATQQPGRGTISHAHQCLGGGHGQHPQFASGRRRGARRGSHRVSAGHRRAGRADVRARTHPAPRPIRLDHPFPSGGHGPGKSTDRTLRLGADRWFHPRRLGLALSRLVSIRLGADRWFHLTVSVAKSVTLVFQSALVRTGGFTGNAGWQQQAPGFNPPWCGQVVSPKSPSPRPTLSVSIRLGADRWFHRMSRVPAVVENIAFQSALVRTGGFTLPSVSP